MFAARLRLCLLVMGDLALLIALRDEPARLVHVGTAVSVQELRRRLDTGGVDTAAGAIAAAVLWLAAIWFAIGLTACVAAALPGAPGRIAARVARVALPRAVYRIAAGAAGLGVLLAPVTAVAHGSIAQRPSTSATPAPIWPTDDPVPAPAWPTSPQPHHAAPVRRAATTTPPAARPQRSVVVRPGDSLWRIAAQHLRPSAPERRVATQWPRWYAANRSVIGADPDHIVAGQVLVPPHARPQNHQHPQRSQP